MIKLTGGGETVSEATTQVGINAQGSPHPDSGESFKLAGASALCAAVYRAVRKGNWAVLSETGPCLRSASRHAL